MTNHLMSLILSPIRGKDWWECDLSLSFLRYVEPRSRGVIKRTRHDTALRELIVVKGWIVNFTGDRQPADIHTGYDCY